MPHHLTDWLPVQSLYKVLSHDQQPVPSYSLKCKQWKERQRKRKCNFKGEGGMKDQRKLPEGAVTEVRPQERI